MVRAVGIKELKAKLSEYVRRACGGETILVLDRDDVVAELRPPRRHLRGGSDLEETLEALAETGEVARAARAKGRWTWKVKGLGLPSGTASRLLDEVRADRRRRFPAMPRSMARHASSGVRARGSPRQRESRSPTTRPSR